MASVRIIVVDAQQLVAEGLRARLEGTEGIQVVGHAGSGKALFKLLENTEADLVLLDVSLPEMDGIDTTRRLRQEHPTIKVLGHSSLTAIEYVNSMLIEGAYGYVVKGGTKEELVEAIEHVMAGRKYLSIAAEQSVAQGYAHTTKRMDGEYMGLTDREREVIRLIALERTNEEIADALHVSVETVKSHRKNLMAKLNVRSIAGLVKYALDRRWI